MRSALLDKLVETRIGAAFAEHISPSMAPLGVSVTVADRKATLGGMSCSGSLRRRAERIANALSKGVADRQSHRQRAEPWPAVRPKGCRTLRM
jgi:hypothetical protein